LRFMQRQQERALRQRLEREQIKALAQSEWVLEYDALEIGKPKFHVEYEPSYLPFTDLTAKGRRSYQKFNGDVESLAKEGIESLKRKFEGFEHKKFDTGIVMKTGNKSLGERWYAMRRQNSLTISEPDEDKVELPPVKIPRLTNSDDADGQDNDLRRQVGFLKPAE